MVMVMVLVMVMVMVMVMGLDERMVLRWGDDGVGNWVMWSALSRRFAGHRVSGLCVGRASR